MQHGLTKKNEFNISFDQASLKLAINFLLDNCFFNFDNFSFQKIAGIPMCSATAPFVANLTFCYYENKWLLDTKKGD